MLDALNDYVDAFDAYWTGEGYREASAFSEDLKKTWISFNLAALDKEAARLDRILAGGYR